MLKEFDEKTRVQIPGTIQFLRLGYDYQSLKDPNVNIDFQTKIFINRFKPALERINQRSFTDKEIEQILLDINLAISNDDLGKSFYNWLVRPNDRVKLIDFNNIENNDFAVVDELSFSIIRGTDKGSFRPDINVLINGIPLAFLEVKPPNNEGGIEVEFDRMINERFKNPSWRKYFNLIQIVSFSNNMKYEDDVDASRVKAGSFYTTPNGTKTTFSFFREEKGSTYHQDYPYIDVSRLQIESVLSDNNYDSSSYDAEFEVNLDPQTWCNQFITSLFDKDRLLFVLHYGIMYIDEGNSKEKHIMRYPQIRATRKIIQRLDSGEKRGIVWHCQGSGKTELAAYSNRVIKDHYAKIGTTAEFFFIVDRISLAEQAKIKFEQMGYSVVTCSSKAKLGKILSTPLYNSHKSSSLGEFVVVNVQKIDLSKIKAAKNDYGAEVQRIFFVDEAHRSYKKSTGEFYKNLMLCADDGVFIALTGTPLLSKKERTSLKFGDYIDTYFYDESIADGYTLKIFKEPVSGFATTEVKNNLLIESKQINDKSVYESEDYLTNLVDFIANDFREFRKNRQDPTIGGMVVCKSNKQAKLVCDLFKKNSDLRVEVVLSDTTNPEQKKNNEKFQKDFAEDNSSIDLLVVHYMLTTGYDAHRLKRLYLLRGAHSESLLQTISRVNRPYKLPNGNPYPYGYLVDFADIENEYKNTIGKYTEELERYYNGDTGENYSLDQLVDYVDTLEQKYQECLNDLNKIISIDNREYFSRDLEKFDKNGLYNIKKLLSSLKDWDTEFDITKTKNKNKIDPQLLNELISLTQRRINFVNLNSNPIDTLNILDDPEVIEITYEFVKGKSSILDPKDFIKNDKISSDVATMLIDIKNALERCENKETPEVQKLDERLKEIFAHLSISSETSPNDDLDELSELLNDINDFNNKNKKILERYGNVDAFLKVINDYVSKYKLDEDELERVMDIVHAEIADTLRPEVLSKLGRANFVDNTKSKISIQLLDEHLYTYISKYLDELLSDLYRALTE